MLVYIQIPLYIFSYLQLHMKVQCNLKIDSDILDRYRKICKTGGFEYSELVEELIRKYIMEWDEIFSSRVASYTQEKTPVCACGHPICSLWERCIYCGRFTSWKDVDPHVSCISDEELKK
jgi:hypothetical protein